MHRAARRLVETMSRNDLRHVRTEDGDAARPEPTARILGCPASGAADALALQALAQELGGDPLRMDTLWASAGSLDILATVESTKPRAVCVAALPPRGALAARYLCRRLRRQFPDLPIVALVLEADDEPPATAPLVAAGANVVVTSVRTAREALLEFVSPALVTDQIAV
jgi:CheY-like chemotaxis protein